MAFFSRCVAAAFLALASALFAQAVAGETDNAAAIESIIRERHEAGVRGDKETWRKHIADDCIWLGPGVNIGTITEVEEAQVDVGVARTIEDVSVRLYDKAAVATDIVSETLVQGDKTSLTRMRKSTPM